MAEDNIKDLVRADQANVKSEKLARRALIDSAYPAAGTPQPAHLGSQSEPPVKQDETKDMK